MKHCSVFFALLVTVFFTSLTAQSPEWGNDVRIFHGNITCFDSDYLSNGHMFAVVQKDTVVMSPDSYPIIIYRSTNHGGTWHVYDTIQSLGKYERMKVLISELGDDYLFIFFFNIGGLFNRLCLHRYNLTTHALQSNELVYAYAWPNSFDATIYEHNGDSTISVLFWSEDSHLHIRHSDDRGVNWYGTWFINAQGKAFDSDVSICRGPRDEIYTAWSASLNTQIRDSLNIYGYVWDGIYGSPIGDSFLIASRTYACVQPKICCSNDLNNPAVWCAYTHECDLFQNDLDAYVASIKHPDSTEYGWSQTAIALSYQMESPTDIRYYKSFGNMYVNMTYLYHDNQYDTTKIFWGWAAGSNHTSWSFNSAPINNHPSHFFADGTSPRLCYSPGATGSGSAVLYAGYNHSDLWIDAPWTLGVEEIPENVLLETFMVYPSVLRPYSTVFLVLPQDGIYNASIYDITGRTVAEYSEITGVKGINSLEIGNLGAGVYFMEIYEPEKPSLKARITVL